jgi:membrane protease YdiL (CAAX protease family)
MLHGMSRFSALIGNRFTLVAITFELSLGLLGWLLSWAVGAWPMVAVEVVDRHAAWRDVGIGVGIGMVTALPFLAGVVLVDRYPIGFLRPLANVVHEDVVPLFRGTGVMGLLAIACAAGVGEELLFRGFLQQTVADWWGLPAGQWIGLAVASVVFGVCHSLCAAYAVLATVMGLALGGLFLATAHLAAPIAMHAVYDGLALLYLVRWSRA